MAETKKSRKKILPIILGIILLGGLGYGANTYIYSLHHEDTDDAQIDGDISPVVSRVTGYVDSIFFEENQLVKKGDVLIRLDNRDLQIKVQQAQAALDNSIASVSVTKANVSTAQATSNSSKANVENAKIRVWQATQDFNRYQNLLNDHSITQQQYEQALAGKQTTEKQLTILEEQKKQAQQQTNAVSVQSNATASQVNIADATIHQRQVDINAAKLNLSYTVITAPLDGMVSKVNVQPGQFVQAGQPLFAVVHSENVWVIANFKETQLDKMKEGQKVVVKVDAYPGHKFEAKLTSFSPATGSTFALLPPDNASGNFVKVVQRLPVKIEFTDPSDALVKKLRPGMNVFVDVHLD
jgi:membrane fusion protein (multidrug efflux system)